MRFNANQAYKRVILRFSANQAYKRVILRFSANQAYKRVILRFNANMLKCYYVLQCITSEERKIIMTISLRLNERDTMLFKKYAELHRITMSELIRQSVLEKIEDEYDLQAYQKAIEEYKLNSVTYTHEEVWNEIDL